MPRIEQTDVIVIPTDHSRLEKIKKVLESVSDSMSRAQGEREYQSEAIKALAEETEIKAKFLRKIAVEYFKQNHETESAGRTEIDDLYESVFEISHVADGEE